MPHRTRHEQSPGEALEPAAADLRRSAGAIRESAAARLAERRDGVGQALRSFAHAQGLIFDPWEVLAPVAAGGREHLVGQDEAHDRYVKLPRQNCFDRTIAAEWFLDERDEAELKPAMRRATPLEYRERQQLHNNVFGDTIELVGIVNKRQALHVATSQPINRGSEVNTDVSAALMRGLGFKPLQDFHVGRLGAKLFLRQADSIAAFDCHSANQLGAGGDVFASDGILVRADEELLAALAGGA